jgi:hypothetical protein
MSSDRNRRVGWGIVLAILLFCAAAAGGLIYGASVTPRDTGLAGPAIVLGYALMAGLAGMLAGVLAAAFSPAAQLAKISLAGAIVAAVMIVVLVVWSMGRREQRSDSPSESPKSLTPTSPVAPDAGTVP